MIAGSRAAADTADAVCELAEFVAGTSVDDLPASALARAQRVFADSVGVAVDGSRRAEVRTARERTHGSGHAVVLAPGFPRLEERDAALLNAIAMCGTELDEGVRPTGHPAIHVIPAAMASAQASNLPGADFVAAVVVGYEVQARIARAAGRLRGNIHCHGNLGHAGAAAALARLEGWSAPQVAAAMNAAAGFASATSYSLPFHGASIHSSTPALSATVAVMVRHLIGAGFTAFGGSIGEVFGEILGDRFDSAALVDGLGGSWAIEEGYVKFHAACGHAHAVLDAAGAALGGFDPGASAYPRGISLRLDPDAVESVEVTLSAPAAMLAHLPPVEAPLAARFSIPFAVATFLTHGRAGVEEFTAPKLREPRVWALAERVRVSVDDAFTDAYPERTPSAVVVRMRNGQVLRGASANPYGNPVSPAGPAHVREKFESLIATALPPDAAARLWEAATTVSTLATMRHFPESGTIRE